MTPIPPQPEKPAPPKSDPPKPDSPAQMVAGSYDENNFKVRLSEEYKILQDKIDKIGAFRFAIKGWSITAVVAASAAANGKELSTAFIISLGLTLMLAFFFWLESEQVRWSRLFGNRAGRIEDAFRRISRGRGRDVYEAFPVPYTAHELVLASYRAKSSGRKPQSSRTNEASSPWLEKWHIYKQAHVGFYVVLIALALVPLLTHYHEIGVYWGKLKETAIHILQKVH